MKKEEIHYESLTDFDSSLFSSEDWSAYKDLLSNIPYDPELARFFHEEKRHLQRMERSDRRHTAFSLDQSQFEKESAEEGPEEACMRAAGSTEFRQHLTMILSETEMRRFSAWCFDDMSYTEIAAMEGISRQCISRTIDRSMKKLKKSWKWGAFNGLECRKK